MKLFVLLSQVTPAEATPSAATMRAQATPQHVAVGCGNEQPPKDPPAEHHAPPAQEPMAVETSDSQLKQSLPPPGVTLPPVPVAQILPSEIEQASEFNSKEDALLMQLNKMDDAELANRVIQAKQHPMFAMFEIDVIQPEHDDCPHLNYFGEDPIQDLCEFYLYLDTQGCDKSQQASILQNIQTPQPPSEPEPPNGCEVESTQLDALSEAMESLNIASPVPDTAVVVSPPAATSPAPVVTKLLPDNQLGDSSLFPSPSPSPAPVAAPVCTPSRVVKPQPQQHQKANEDAALQWQPITAEGMKAFWSVLRRKSTDDLSHAAPSPAALPAASAPPPGLTPQGPPVPAITPPAHTATPPHPKATLSSPEAPMPPATPPAPTITAPAPEATPLPAPAATPPAPTITAPAPECQLQQQHHQPLQSQHQHQKQHHRPQQNPTQKYQLLWKQVYPQPTKLEKLGRPI